MGGIGLLGTQVPRVLDTGGGVTVGRVGWVHLDRLQGGSEWPGKHPRLSKGYPTSYLWPEVGAGVEWAGEAESSGTLGVVSWISSRVDTKVPVTGG